MKQFKGIRFNLSPEQKRRIKKGFKIRVNPKSLAMEGEGICMLVKPDKFNALTKAFDGNRGLQFQLDDDEIDINMKPELIDDEEVRAAVEMEGMGSKKRKKRTANNPFIQAGRKAREGQKQVKKGVKKAAKQAKRGLDSAIDRVKNEVVDALPQEVKDVARDVSSVVKAVKKFDFDKVDAILKDIPKFYRDELRETYVGETLRQALRMGTVWTS